MGVWLQEGHAGNRGVESTTRALFLPLELDLVLETEFFVKWISSHANFVFGFVLNSKADLLRSQEEIDDSCLFLPCALLFGLEAHGAGERSRTPTTLTTKQLHYRYATPALNLCLGISRVRCDGTISAANNSVAIKD